MKDILLDELNEKIADVNILIDEIKNLSDIPGKIKTICILKSSIIISLYNTIESMMTIILTSIHDKISPISFMSLSDKNKKIFISYHFNKRVNMKKTIFEDLIKNELSFPDFNNLNKKTNMFSGNLDARKIDEILNQYGINKLTPSNRELLLYVKNKRNKLAHGEELFSNACRDKTIGDIEDIRNEVTDSLKLVIDNVENYLARGLYKKTT